MHIDKEQGRLQGVRFVASPNCDERPDGCLPDVIVVHGISLPPGQFEGPAIEQLFTNVLNIGEHPYFEQLRDLRVSAHVLIRRDAEVVQFVPFHKRAWHAGASEYQGRTGCNDFSIGIELEGSDEQPYAQGQIQVLAEIIQALLHTYPTFEFGNAWSVHSDIAPGAQDGSRSAF